MNKVLHILPLMLIAAIWLPVRVSAQEPVEDVMAGICEELYEEPAKDIEKTSGKFLNLFEKDKIGQTWNRVWGPTKAWCQTHGVANHLDAGISVGVMGIGLELKTPATRWADLRIGFDWMPEFSVPLRFNLNTFAGGVATNNFQKIAATLYNATGIVMDETVNVTGRASMINFKLLIDVYPLQSNRHWHLTAGFYAGSSLVGKARNNYEEKPTLVGLNIYNRAYEYFTNLESIFNVPLGGGAYMDPDLVIELRDKFEKYGRMGVRIGNFKDGTPYIMEPSPDGSVSAKAYVNHFKPYLGAGYSTDLDSHGRWHFGVDLGVLFWGGRPDVINHDYVNGREINFTKDLVNIRGKVKDYMNIIKAFPVLPVVEFRFSYSIL
ncbi:MAG: hypothetical protein J1D77_07520 [Muribaculaceae bacterium]|nr:hypothetical protein [Muribaculaceae bacterium]